MSPFRGAGLALLRRLRRRPRWQATPPHCGPSSSERRRQQRLATRPHRAQLEWLAARCLPPTETRGTGTRGGAAAPLTHRGGSGGGGAISSLLLPSESRRNRWRRQRQPRRPLRLQSVASTRHPSCRRHRRWGSATVRSCGERACRCRLRGWRPVVCGGAAREAGSQERRQHPPESARRADSAAAATAAVLDAPTPSLAPASHRRARFLPHPHTPERRQQQLPQQTRPRP